MADDPKPAMTEARTGDAVIDRDRDAGVEPARRADGTALRTLFGILVGIATALVFVFFIEGVQLELLPVADTLDRSDPAQFATLPLTAYLFQLGSWFIGAFAGSLTAQRLTGSARAGWTPVAVIMAICLLNRFALPLPLWMVAAGIALPLVGHWLASLFVRGAVTGRP